MPVNGDIRAYKSRLRERMRRIRSELPAQVKENYDKKIAARVLSLREYRENPCIFVYISKDIEVSTGAIVSAALSDGKTVAAPKCVPETRKTDFYRITSLDQLEKGCYGLSEPVPAVCEKIEDFSRGLCIVPGLGFDLEGYRLGFGMGYYDRFLSGFGGSTVGVCYSACVCEKLPHGYYDRRINTLITERYIKNFKSF